MAGRHDSLLTLNEIKVAPNAAGCLFLAGKIFLRYRTAGSVRTGVLPDFFVGAHAAVLKIPS